MELLNIEATLINYYQERKKNILTILTIPVNKYKPVDYHNLRIEIKKVKALLELINYCYKDFQKKQYFKICTKIFKQSGKIRELQMEESILEKYDIVKIGKYLISVKEDIRKKQKEFQLLVQKKHRRKIKKTLKKIDPFLKELPTKKIDDFLEKEKRKINKITLQNPLEPENLHELRKILKIDLYNKKSLHLCNKKELEIENNFQELLGKWHDGRDMSNLIEKSIIKYKNDSEELKQLLQINEETRTNTRKLNNEINKNVEFKSLFV